MLKLDSRVAIVTGGSRGIGKAISLKLASCGAKVAVIYCGNEQAATSVKEEISEAYGVECEIYQCDVRDALLCKRVVEQISASLGMPDILVNNAGITKDSLLMTMEKVDFDCVIETNLSGAFNMTKACGRSFIKNKSGKIINISSVSGIMGIAGQANYSASKAGLIAMTKVMAREFGSKGVCCNAIAPGFIETDMTAVLANKEEFLKSIPLKRFGKAQEVAELVAFLASDASNYITGECIRIDGGIAM